VLLAGAVAALATSTAVAVVPRSYYELTIIINDQQTPAVGIHLILDSPFQTSDVNTTARTIDIAVTGGLALLLNGVAGGTVTDQLVNRTGDVWYNVTAQITEEALANMSANPSTPFVTSVDVTIVYTDLDGARPRTIRRSVTFQLNYRAPPMLDALSAAFAGLGGAGAIGLSLYVGRRGRLEELYLMHDSGMLIRHWTRRQGAVHDTDIMSGMFIVLQEFVRDSFNDRQSHLERLRFGPRQVAMARGHHVVLAAVVRGRYLAGLPRRLRDSVEDFEGHYAEILQDWDGNVDRFPAVDIVGWRFMKSRPGDTAA
jgi:hypothetical protein